MKPLMCKHLCHYIRENKQRKGMRAKIRCFKPYKQYCAICQVTQFKMMVGPKTLLFINVSFKYYPDSETERNAGWQAISVHMLKL